MTSTAVYDVILIGAGSVGVPTAFFLSRAGLKTLVLDSNPSVGQGSNKRAIGGIRATHSDPAKIRLCQRSLDIFSTWKETYGNEIEWFQGGYYYVAYREQEKDSLQELIRVQKGFGLNVDWLDASQSLTLLPDLNPEGLLGGSFSPEDGSASPLLSIHAFYQHAIQSGADFHFREPVIKIDQEKGRITSVSTSTGTYSTRLIINCSGAKAREISRMVGFDVPVYPDSHEAAITEPVKRFIQPMVVDTRPGAGSANDYFYQHLTGQIVFCITPQPAIPGEDVRETSSFLPMVSRRLLDVMPRLKYIRVRRTWRGLYPMTPDGFPIVGFSKEVEGFFSAVGMCGQGFMLGPGIGELIQRAVLNTTDAADQDTLIRLSPYREFSGSEKLR